MLKYRKRWYILLVIAILLFIFDIGFFIMGKYYPNTLNKGITTLPKQDQAVLETQANIKENLKDIKIESQYAMMLDLEDFTVLYEKNINDKIYPASLTKVMSAIVALDHIDDLNKTVTVEKNDLKGLVEANASVAGLKENDTVTYEDLLYALVLPSGADAANVLANHLFGSMDAFVAEMNNKAKSYGMTSTHFINATGLHDDDHYTTITDLKQMMKYAWRNTAFQKILTTQKYKISNINLSFESTLVLYGDSLSFQGGEIIGGKSGFTYEAECCLISVAKLDNGHQYMLITANAPGSPIEDHKHIDDAKQLYSNIHSS